MLDLDVFTFPDSINREAVPRINATQSIQAGSYCNSTPCLDSLLEQSQDVTFLAQCQTIISLFPIIRYLDMKGLRTRQRTTVRNSDLA